VARVPSPSYLCDLANCKSIGSKWIKHSCDFWDSPTISQAQLLEVSADAQALSLALSAWSKGLEVYLNLSACATALASLVCLIVTHSSGSQMLSGSAALAALARLILSNVSSKNKHRLSEDHANFS